MSKAGDGLDETAFEGQALIVAGPTCSGKSAIAVMLARHFDGVVINADSMQVYRELRIVTARPEPEDEAACPHVLYGVRAASSPGSVAWWREQAVAEMRVAWRAGRLPILCGGSGLYFAALTDGLTDIPEPGQQARSEARDLLARIGPGALHARLLEHDPETARVLRPSDSQRLARAWEVLCGTGQGLSAWHRTARMPAAPASFSSLLLAPAREPLKAALAARFAGMLRRGALDEVDRLLQLGLPADVPAMRALGVSELAAHLRGTMPLAEAQARAVAAQARYAKRQATWFTHHQLAPPQRADTLRSRIAGMTQLSESQDDKIISFVHGCIDEGGRSRS